MPRALLFLLLAACSKTLEIKLEVVTACDQTDALEGMQGITLKAEGDALDAPRDRNFSYTAGGGRLPEIPPTAHAKLTFTARRGSEESPIEVAGGSGPYDFSGVNTAVGTNVRIVVGRTNSFSGTSSGSKPTMCTLMARGREGHTATVLQDGRVLIVGGEEMKEGSLLLLKSTEIYSPEFGTFAEGPDMPEGRSYHTASVLPSGGVLICGGRGAIDNRQVALDTCRIFDPQTNDFTAGTMQMNTGRMMHRAVTLDDGRVIQLGGITVGTDYVSSTEIYDAAAEPVLRLAPSANMLIARAHHTATALTGDSVLITGGRNESDVVGTIELWSTAGSKKLADGAPRYSHAAARAGDGRVVIAGGFTNIVDLDNPKATGAVEIFDPIGGGSVSCASSLSLLSPRGELFAIALPRTGDGIHRVLVAGGTTQDGMMSDLAETVTLSRGRACSDTVIDATRNTMRTPRARAVSTLLFGGDVLITGGATQPGADSTPATEGELFFVPR